MYSPPRMPGIGKRTPIEQFPVKGRGTQGVIAIQVSDRNGAVVGAVQVFAGEELMLRRVLGADGRSRAWINGTPVPIQTLRELGDQQHIRPYVLLC